MPELPLIFQGTRWPAAKAAGLARVLTLTSDGSRPMERDFVNLITSGEGGSWAPAATDGTWRDLAELDLGNTQACEAFARRRGDPSVRLVSSNTGEGNILSTGLWFHLADALRTAASAWEPPGKDGISHITDDTRRLLAASRFLDFPTAAQARKEFAVVRNVVDGAFSLALLATTPAAFLVASAATALQHRADMRRCRHCQSWFEITRSDVRFCSASCRATHHKTEKEIAHGEHQEKAGQGRPDNLAKRMARTGKERPALAADKEPRKRQGRPRTRI